MSVSGICVKSHGRGKFRSSGARQKWLFSGALIVAQTRYFASLSLQVIWKFVPHTAAAAAQVAARTAVHESFGAVRSRKGQCQALPDNPETGDISHVK